MRRISISDYDVVYLDAGTTTELMIDPMLNRNAMYVTNAIGHARKLAALGCTVYLLGGEFKGTTDAIVGEEAVLSIAKYNFTKGFFRNQWRDGRTGIYHTGGQRGFDQAQSTGTDQGCLHLSRCQQVRRDIHRDFWGLCGCKPF